MKIRYINCIKSLGNEFKIIVIENSNDKNLKYQLEKNFLKFKCILSEKNLGYAKGNNLGLSMVKTKYALIINPDAEVHSQTINNFFLAVKLNPDFAIIAPFIQEKNDSKLEENVKELLEVKNVKGFAMFLNIDQV